MYGMAASPVILFMRISYVNKILCQFTENAGHTGLFGKSAKFSK